MYHPLLAPLAVVPGEYVLPDRFAKGEEPRWHLLRIRWPKSRFCGPAVEVTATTLQDASQVPTKLGCERNPRFERIHLHKQASGIEFAICWARSEREAEAAWRRWRDGARYSPQFQPQAVSA